MTTATASITTEICAYCHTQLGEGDPIRCKYGVRFRGVKVHSFREITMDARLAEMIQTAGLEADTLRPNFFYGFDLPTEGVRFSTEYPSGDENIDMLVFDGDPERSVLKYRVSFQDGTPLSVIFAAAAEAMGF